MVDVMSEGQSQRLLSNAPQCCHARARAGPGIFAGSRSRDTQAARRLLYVTIDTGAVLNSNVLTALIAFCAARLKARTQGTDFIRVKMVLQERIASSRHQ
jgi:hypothetical protein